jgi:hypothetical protein
MVGEASATKIDEVATAKADEAEVVKADERSALVDARKTAAEAASTSPWMEDQPGVVARRGKSTLSSWTSPPSLMERG